MLLLVRNKPLIFWKFNPIANDEKPEDETDEQSNRRNDRNRGFVPRGGTSLGPGRHPPVGQGGGTGTFTVAGGTLIASNLEVNTASRFFFNKGLVQTRTAAVASTVPFV